MFKSNYEWLDNVLHALSTPSIPNENQELSANSSCDTEQVQTLEIGEHVAAFWYDDFAKLDWFLAIVDGQIKDTKVALSYMKQSKKTKPEWVFPEDAEVRETSLEQIIFTKVNVNYFCSVRVRCIIPDETVNLIDAVLTQKMK